MGNAEKEADEWRAAGDIFNTVAKRITTEIHKALFHSSNVGRCLEHVMDIQREPIAAHLRSTFSDPGVEKEQEIAKGDAVKLMSELRAEVTMLKATLALLCGSNLTAYHGGGLVGGPFRKGDYQLTEEAKEKLRAALPAAATTFVPQDEAAGDAAAIAERARLEANSIAAEERIRAGRREMRFLATQEGLRPHRQIGDVKGYEDLARVLTAAYDQSARGKGKERHSSGSSKAFADQPINTLPAGMPPLAGLGGVTYQVQKKTGEALRMVAERSAYGPAKAEFLGAIVYLTAAYLQVERMEQSQPPASA